MPSKKKQRSQFAILSKFLKSLEIWSRSFEEPFMGALVFKYSSCVNADEGVTGDDDVDNIIGGVTCSVVEFNNLRFHCDRCCSAKRTYDHLDKKYPSVG